MKKCLSLLIVLVLALASVASLSAQQILTGSARGNCKDDSGKPIDGATVEMLNTDNGRKMVVKTNSKGEYLSMGLSAGTYKFTLMKDGKVLDEFNNVPIQVGAEQVVNFDIAKDRLQPGVSEEEKKKIEAAQQQNAKIKDLNARLQQVQVLEKAGNYDQAVTLLQEATQMAPQQDLLWAYLGDAYKGDKKYPEAIEAYNKAIAIKSTVPQYHAGLGDVYGKLGQTDKAVQEYGLAAQADPTHAGQFYFNQGAVLTNSGKADEANAAFDKAIQADPNNAAAYYWKGVNLFGKSELKDGKTVAPAGTAEMFNKYLSLDPNGQYAEGAKQMLAAIGASVETSYGKGKSAPKKKP